MGAPSAAAPTGGLAGRCHLTPVGAGVVGAGLAILGLSFYTLNLLLFAVALLAVGFVTLEYLGFAWTTRGFSARWFLARREGTVPRVDVHGTGSAGITISHRGRRGFYVEIFDAHPDDFEMRVGSPRLRTFLSPGASCTLFYVFRPGTRGLYTVGPTSVVAHDALGLVFRTALLDTRTNLFVTPPRPSLGAGASFARLRTRLLGVQALRRRGYGTEFRSLREYLPTDDYRTIAWKRSTKGKYYVREFEQENRQDFLVLLDTSAGMSVGLPGEAALDKAVEAVQVLTAYVARREDRIGLLGWASGANTYIPPGRGPGHLAALTRALGAVQVESKPFDGAGALAFLSGKLTTRTHVIVFTAATDPGDPFKAAYDKFCSKGHRLYAFVPSVQTFYPPVAPGIDDRALQIAREVEGRREQGANHAVRSLGIPLFPYERGGAVDPVVALYSTLRAWGYARG